MFTAKVGANSRLLGKGQKNRCTQRPKNSIFHQKGRFHVIPHQNPRIGRFLKKSVRRQTLVFGRFGEPKKAHFWHLFRAKIRPGLGAIFEAIFQGRRKRRHRIGHYLVISGKNTTRRGDRRAWHFGGQKTNNLRAENGTKARGGGPPRTPPKLALQAAQ